MKHRLLKVLAAMLCLAAGPAGAQQGRERIIDFHSDVIIHEDASLTVVETIRVMAQHQEINRGIYRDFPRLYKGSMGLRRGRGFEVERVLRDGKPEQYTIEKIGGGTRVRIGRADVMLEVGEHTFTIQYRTTRQLGYFEGHDELYWNVTGNGWAFPIDHASARVTLPGDTRPLEVDAYTGPARSKGKNFRSEANPDGSVSIETTKPLAAEEGLTIVVTWPKGKVDYAADPQGLGPAIRDNPGAAFGLFGYLGLLIYFFVVWARLGKDPEAGTIIPLYEPPEGFSPAAVRNLYRMGFDDQAFSAAVIGLAAKGKLTIEEDHKEYTLRRAGGSAPLAPDERTLYKNLMGGSRSLKLAQSNHSTIGGAKTALKNSLSLMLETKYFVRNLKFWIAGLVIAAVPLLISVLAHNPEGLFMLIWLTAWSAGTMFLVSNVVTSWRSGAANWAATLFALPFVAGWVVGVVVFTIQVSLAIALIFGLSVITVGVFYHLMKAPTLAGRRILDHIEGFKQYLSVAEADRLNLINPPERTPELFEKFLPYALALDVDQEWSEQFSGVLSAAGQAPADGGPHHYSPSFYTGSSTGRNLAAGAFASAIAGSLTSALATSSVSPSSSSGGGGGGSSGGGGGGGGGGGW